jgi:hypothetical protein
LVEALDAFDEPDIFSVLEAKRNPDENSVFLFTGRSGTQPALR